MKNVRNAISVIEELLTIAEAIIKILKGITEIGDSVSNIKSLTKKEDETT